MHPPFHFNKIVGLRKTKTISMEDSSIPNPGSSIDSIIMFNIHLKTITNLKILFLLLFNSCEQIRTL